MILIKKQKIQKQLQDEVDLFWIEQENKSLSYNDLKRLPFMTKCIMETLRLWPALTNGTYRELEEDDYITDYYGNKLTLKKAPGYRYQTGQVIGAKNYGEKMH